MNYNEECTQVVLTYTFAIFAIFVFVPMLALSTWGTVMQIANLPTNALHNIAAVASFTREITITNQNSLIPSNEKFKLYWEYIGRHPEKSIYTFNYSCTYGVTFKVLNNEGVYKTVICDSPFLFTSNTNSLQLIPVSDISRFMDVPVVITSVNNKIKPITSDEKLLTIVNKKISRSIIR